MVKEFKVKTNIATILFLGTYTIYTILLALHNQIHDFIYVATLGIILYIFFIGCRPYKYTIDRKILTIHYRLWRKKEINLMICETICDPVSRLSDIAARPHAIEIYSNTKKRYCFFPVKRVEFVGTIVQANKRIHCSVKDYTDVHRQLEKKLRKEKRKAEKNAIRK